MDWKGRDQSGRPIRESRELAGSKWAVLRGGVLYVSPAMMKLISDCQTAGSLFRLLDQIPTRTVKASAPFPKG